MPRSRRRSKSPAARASALARKVSSLLTLAGFIAFLPVVFVPGGRPQPTWLALLAVLVLLTAVLWWRALAIRRWQQAAGRTLDELQSLTPDAFEEWTAARFRERGYRVRLVGSQGDHGIDLAVRKGDERAVVQVKNYRAQAVGEPVLRDLFGAMHAERADRAYLVTTGQLTEPARAWAEGKPITIWSGADLARMRADRDPTKLAVASGHAAATSPCPSCGAALVVRTNGKTLERFLGCSTYPRCRKTLPIPA